MKILKLSIAERLVALAIFNNPQNRVSMENLKIYLDDVGKFRISEADKKAVAWEDILNEKGILVSAKWQPSMEEPKKIEIEPFFLATSVISWLDGLFIIKSCNSFSI